MVTGTRSKGERGRDASGEAYINKYMVTQAEWPATRSVCVCV